MKLKKILVDYGERRLLARTFNTSYVTVRAALSGSCDSPLCLRIRKYALQRGGTEVQAVLTPRSNDPAVIRENPIQ